MDFLIDPSRERFLGDHVVHGSPLLPTVLGLDLMLRGLGNEVALAAAVVVADLVVNSPVVFDAGTPRTVTIDSTSSAAASGDARWMCALRTANESEHFSASIQPSTTELPLTGTACRFCHGDGSRDRAPGISASMIYPPYFHGPSFQVLDSLHAQGDGLTATYNNRLAPLTWSFAEFGYPVRLLELVMQACGIWLLANSGQMMIPDRIVAVRWGNDWSKLAPNARIRAHIAPRFQPSNVIFDGSVCVDGQVLLELDGYHTVDLGSPADLTLSAKYRALLANPESVVPADDLVSSSVVTQGV